MSFKKNSPQAAMTMGGIRGGRPSKVSLFFSNTTQTMGQMTEIKYHNKMLLVLRCGSEPAQNLFHFI
jgi:hypothetical protein